MNKDTEKKIQQFQMIEQQLDNIMLQKQNFQIQLVENENASKELEKSDKTPYKIIGTIMVSSGKDNLLKDLKESKEIIELRLKTLERQENNLKEKAESLQKGLMEELK
jgi:prefoldin beta subunit